MDFRVTVRDNRANGGGVATDDMIATVEDGAGPFAVTYPNGGESVSGTIDVTWNVAGTSSAPINTSMVDILLSTDGGSTFSTVLANDTSNDGSQSVDLGGNTTSTARIMIRGEGNIYFDVSNGTFSIGIPTGTPVEYTSTDVPKTVGPIGSEVVPVTSTLNVPDSITIADVNVKVNINHTWDSDLAVDITSPLGTTRTLFNAVGNDGDNFTNTILDDEASIAIASGTAPFTGSYIPDQSLSAFDSQNGQGTWTLTVEDTYPFEDSGTLLGWSIIITPPLQSLDPDNVYVDFSFAGSEVGTESNPFNTLGEAVAAANANGTIHILPGVSGETVTITKALTLQVFDVGTATVGSA